MYYNFYKCIYMNYIWDVSLNFRIHIKIDVFNLLELYSK